MGLASAIIDRLDLFNHDKAGNFEVIWDRDVEWESPIFVGKRANYSKTRMFVKLSVAYNQCRPAASLLVARLRIEGYGNEVALFRDVGPHLPHLSADRYSPIDFPSLIVLGDT